uniref:Uncharacterized protein n=1 Tax=Anopheles melas TaxID=34690 RepID=A0A182TEK4_9DIPT
MQNTGRPDCDRSQSMHSRAPCRLQACDKRQPGMSAAACQASFSHALGEGTESGWDNPFRPGGDLSREADEIVNLIKGGKPITPTGDQSLVNGSTPKDSHSTDDPDTTVVDGDGDSLSSIGCHVGLCKTVERAKDRLMCVGYVW